MRFDANRSSEPAPPVGFEPTVSSSTGRRALRAAPRGRIRRESGRRTQTSIAGVRSRQPTELADPRMFKCPAGVEPPRLAPVVFETTAVAHRLALPLLGSSG